MSYPPVVPPPPAVAPMLMYAQPSGGAAAGGICGPSSYRYWRITINALNGGSGAPTMNELELLGASNGGRDLTTTSTSVTASAGSSGSYTTAKLVDNSATDGNTWQSASATLPQTLTVDLGSAQTVIALTLRTQPGDNLNLAFADFDISGSNDNATFTPLKNITFSGWALGITYVWPTY